MPSRVTDRLRQANHDLEVAATTFEAGQFDWACFAAHQAAEKALKALYQHHHAEGWGHAIRRLIEDLALDEAWLAEHLESARILDKHYIPTRYPNGLPEGAPADAYTATEAKDAIDRARKILDGCQARCGSS